MRIDISTSYRKSGLRITMVASDFRLEVEIWLYRSCAMKNMQYNDYLIAESFIGTVQSMGQIPRSQNVFQV